MNIPNPLSKGAPAAPDYAGAARQDTLANRPNQSTPYGSSNWTQDPKTGAWSQNTSFAGPLAGLNDTLGKDAASAWSTPLDNGAGARQHAEDAIYGRETARLDPMWASREHDMQTQLANQGTDPNSAAYTKASTDFGRNRNDAYSSALQDAIMGGGQEASRQQQMDLTSRMAPLGAMGNLRSLLQMPGFMGGGSQLGAAQAKGNYGLQAQQMDDKFWSDMISGGAKGAGAYMLAACDERLKAEVVRHAAEILPGVPLASFRYVWEPPGTRHFGVIAQDLEAVCPDLVTYRGGYRFVPARFLLT